MGRFGGSCFGGSKGCSRHFQIESGRISVLISENSIDVRAEVEGELVLQVELNYVWLDQHIIGKTGLGKLPSEACV